MIANISATVIVGSRVNISTATGSHQATHVPQWLRQQLTRPRRSQPHRSCKRKDIKPDCDFAIGQHLLENDQCALYEGQSISNETFSIAFVFL